MKARDRGLSVALALACLFWFALIIAGCGTVTTEAPDASDAVTGVGGAGVGGAGVGGAGVGGAGVGGAPELGCVAGCVPTCGTGASSAGCRACPVVDGGSAVMACGAQGFDVCCRFAGDGRAYCSGKELCP